MDFAHRQSPTHSTASDPFIDIPPQPTGPTGPTFSVAHSDLQDESPEQGHPQPDNVTSGVVTIQRRAVSNPVYRSPELINAGKRKIFITKWLFIAVLVAIKSAPLFPPLL
jgi:hypothetical protein